MATIEVVVNEYVLRDIGGFKPWIKPHDRSQWR